MDRSARPRSRVVRKRFAANIQQHVADGDEAIRRRALLADAADANDAKPIQAAQANERSRVYNIAVSDQSFF